MKTKMFVAVVALALSVLSACSGTKTPTAEEKAVRDSIGKPYELVALPPGSKEQNEKDVVVPCGKYFLVTFDTDGLRLMFMYEMAPNAAAIGNFRPSKFAVALDDKLEKPVVTLRDASQPGGIALRISKKDVEDAPCLLMLDELEKLKPGDPKPKPQSVPKIQA